jgi:hypothetical protein
MQKLLATAILATLATGAHADDNAARVADFHAVCSSGFVKSEKLVAACQAEAMPDVIKDGSRFHARGIGAEVNTLAANLHLIASR